MLLTNLSKTYHLNKKKRVQALKNVSCDLGDRGMVFILGPSGSGKSTLLHLLGGFIEPTSGRFSHGGFQSETATEEDINYYRNFCVGFIFQEYNLLSGYSVGENLQFPLILQGKEEDRVKAENILRLVGLFDKTGATYYDRNINELSGGELQRVAIARILMKDPDMVLADEPTGALDSKNSETVYGLLKEISKEKLVIVVTHDYRAAEKYADRMIELQDGEIVSDRNLCTDSTPIEGEGRSVLSSSNTVPKSRFSWRVSFIMAVKNALAKRARLTVSCILSVIFLVCLGVSFSIFGMDTNKIFIKTMYDHDVRMVRLAAGNGNFTEKQWALLKEYSGENPLSEYCSFDGIDKRFDYLGHSFDRQKMQYNSYQNIVISGSGRCVKTTAQTKESDLCIEPDERFSDKTLCRLPRDGSEIAITSIWADMFITYGYRSKEISGEEIKISTPDDLIGREFCGFTICGVYDTEADLEYLRTYDYYLDPKDWYTDLPDYYKNYSGGAINLGMAACFFCHESASLSSGSSYFLKLNDSEKESVSLLKNLFYEENGTEYGVTLYCLYSSFLPDAYVLDVITVVALCVCAFFAVISVLLTMNFLLVDLTYKRKELGILRSLGASKGNVQKICLSESMFIAVMNFVAASILTLLACIVINAVIYIHAFSFSFLKMLLLFAFCLGCTGLATVLPLRKFAEKSVIELIKSE